MARAAALGGGAHRDFVHLEPGVAKPPGEFRDSGPTTRPRARRRAAAPLQRLKARAIVEPVVGLAGQPVRAVVDIEQDRVEGRGLAMRITSPDVALGMLTRGSSRLPPKISAIGPRAQATTAGTSSATVIRAFGPAPRALRAA